MHSYNSGCYSLRLSFLQEEITIDTYEAQAERLLAAVQRTVPSEQNKENVDNTALFLNVTANLLQANATATVPQEVCKHVHLSHFVNCDLSNHAEIHIAVTNENPFFIQGGF